jgi:REP element-mobilizing transposase RayT
MARQPRVEIAGGIYHVIARGNERREIFRDDHDRKIYLARLEECRRRYDFGVLAFCLMPNHVHLAIERGPVPLGKIVLTLHGFYSQKFNHRHDRVGHLFQGRYKAFLIDCERYLGALVRYIHMNPVRAGIVSQPEAYVWSSDRHYRRGAGPPWLDVDFVLRRFASRRSSACAAYRTWMGAPENDDYESVLPVGRVVKGPADFAEASMRAAECRPPRRRGWTPAGFASAASAAQGFTLESLQGPSRRRVESLARRITAYLGRRDYGITTASLAERFGLDESALIHGLRRLETDLSRVPSLRRQVERVAAALEAQKSGSQDRNQKSGFQG